MLRSLVGIATLVLVTFACDSPPDAEPERVLGRVITSDVTRFWEAFDSLATAGSLEDSLQVLRSHYLNPGTAGLHAYVQARVQDPVMLLRAVREFPQYLTSVRPQTLRLDEHATTVTDVFERLADIYPEVEFPDVYFLYSGLISTGISTDTGLLIGADMVSAGSETPRHELPEYLEGVDMTPTTIPCIVAHELVHYQQENEGGTRLLRTSLMEGVADFVAELAVGCHATSTAVYRYGDENEAELWESFLTDQFETDGMRNWLYNGGMTELPANLGYWMGYQIAEAYYDLVPDKAQAIKDMLVIEDSRAFLEASGYDGPG